MFKARFMNYPAKLITIDDWLDLLPTWIDMLKPGQWLSVEYEI